MDFAEWEPTYLRIVRDFGYSVEEDRRGAEALVRVAGSGTQEAITRAERLLANRRASVTGGALRTAPRGLPRPIIATGSSVPVLLATDLVPDVVLTDLDKEVDAQLEACNRGALAVIHAHGDNIPLIEKLAPEFPFPVLCTCQCKPFPGIVNFGGFTDGDRAVLMAREFRATGADLHGFEWNLSGGLKFKKLGWARSIIELQGSFARYR